MLARFLIAIASLPVSFFALAWLFSEIAVHYETWATGAKSRAELANDFGLGLLVMGVALPAALVGSLAVCVLSWWAFFRYRKAHKLSPVRRGRGA